MKSRWTDRIAAEPAAAAAGAAFVLSLATLAGAWFFEYVLKLAPCPLCLEQRIPYHVIVPLSLLLAIAALARAPRKLLIVGFAAILIAACWRISCSASITPAWSGTGGPSEQIAPAR